jgi:hypothetical protein
MALRKIVYIGPSIIWLLAYLGVRIFYNFFGLKFDGNRVISTWMQFPDVELDKIVNLPNIFFNFHAAAPGLPILEVALRFLGDSHWQFLAQALIYSLGTISGMMVLSAFRSQGISQWIVLSILLFTIAINPAMILFDNQFYSTSYVSYGLLICLALLTKAQKKQSDWVTVILIIVALVWIRPTFNFYLMAPFIGYILIKKVRHTLTIILITLIAVGPVSVAQFYRTATFQSFTFSTSSTSGALAEFGSWETSNVKAIRPGYYPYQIRTGALASKLGDNPLLDNPTKVNGLPNWNYRGYLQDFQRDNKNAPIILLSEFENVPRFLIRGIRWAAIDPTCSRVITWENRNSIEPLASNYSKIFHLAFPPILRNSQMPACEDESGLEYMYLAIIAGFSFMSLILVSDLIRRRPGIDRGFLMVFILVALDFYASFTNGSPEMSKYRMETEAPITFLLLFYVCNMLKRRRRSTTHV